MRSILSRSTIYSCHLLFCLRHIHIVERYSLGVILQRRAMNTSAIPPGDRASSIGGAATPLTISACRHELWLTALESIGALEIGPVARRSLWAWIALGVERMQMRDSLSFGHLAIARANLKTFVHLMRTEAVVEGHPGRLDIETLHAARRQLERKAHLTKFTLWPFWPDEFVAPR
jgi:hypothetical protein